MSAAELIKKGIIMGTIHVLTGPDHLSALATLSATDVGSRSRRGENNNTGAPKNWKLRSFFLGVRWGVGHSLGLIVVGGILIGIQAGTTSGEWVGLNTWVFTMLETFVGVFMLVLGSYGITKALKNRRYISVTLQFAESDIKGDRSGSPDAESVGPVKNKVISKNDFVLTGVETQPNEQRRESIVDQMTCVIDTEQIHIKAILDEESDERSLSSAERRLEHSDKSFTNNVAMSASDEEICGKSHLDESAATTPIISSSIMADTHLFEELEVADDSTPAKQDSTPVFSSSANKISLEMLKKSPVIRTCIMGKGHFGRPGTLALLAGVIHGVAGPGGVLGVLPAVEMQDPKAAIIYLGTFCVTSIVVMGGFAVLYGTLCKWLALHGVGEEDTGASLNRVFFVEFASACLSICVGIVWLSLLIVGKMDEVFP